MTKDCMLVLAHKEKDTRDCVVMHALLYLFRLMMFLAVYA